MQANAHASLGQLYEVYPHDFGVSTGSGVVHLNAALALCLSHEKLSDSYEKTELRRKLPHVRYWIGCVYLRLGDQRSAHAAFTYVEP